MTITIKNRFSKIITFAEKPLLFAGFFAVCYEKAFKRKYIPFCKCEKFYSLCHDLSKSPEELLASFKPNTRNEIRKGKKEHFVCTFGIDSDLVRDLHKKMAEEKGMCVASVDMEYSSLKPYLFATCVKFDSNILVAHTFLISQEKKLVMLKTSASSYRKLSKEKQKLTGVANRFLHYQEMLYFRDNGFLCYDFGGYAENANENDMLYSINKFKAGFAGEKVCYYNYKSYIYIIIAMIYRLMCSISRS